MCTSHERGEPRRRGPAPALLLLALGLACATAGGCAALTNPGADALPVRRLPAELRTPPKDDLETIPLTLLGQPQPPDYRLGPGDVLGVYVAGVLGERGQPPPLHVAPLVEARDQRRLPPAVGYPVPVRADGTVALPQLEPLAVTGMSLADVEAAVRKLYAAREILKPGPDQIIVTLLHPRRYQVVVMRQESGNITVGPAGQIGGGKRGTGQVIDLPAYENDVLHALALSGGLPGLDAYDEVVVERGCFQDERGRAAVLAALAAPPAGPGHQIPHLACRQTIHIPLRWLPGKPVPFGPEDVVLQTGDVVFLEARDLDVYYTGGVLPAGMHVLPRDRDLDVVDAVSEVQGSLFNGAFATNNLSGNLIAPGIGGPSPTLLTVVRRTPGGGKALIRVDLDRAVRDPDESLLVRAGDLLILQETPDEALTRFFDQALFNFDLFWTPIHDRFATGVIDIAAPDRLPNRVGIINQVPPP